MWDGRDARAVAIRVQCQGRRAWWLLQYAMSGELPAASRLGVAVRIGPPQILACDVERVLRPQGLKRACKAPCAARSGNPGFPLMAKRSNARSSMFGPWAGGLLSRPQRDGPDAAHPSLWMGSEAGAGIAAGCMSRKRLSCMARYLQWVEAGVEPADVASARFGAASKSTLQCVRRGRSPPVKPPSQGGLLWPDTAFNVCGVRGAAAP